MTTDAETIFALATGSGKAAIAIIRVSGAKCSEILLKLCRRNDWPERRAVYTNIYDADDILLDKGIVLFFPAPRSFTGEDMAELQITGGRAVKDALIRSLAAIPGVRPAEAGEFARRAFVNGKMDLAEVEGLAAIVDAETSAQARHSALMAFGTLSLACEEARGLLIKAASLMEGLLDFSDVEDPDEASVASVRSALQEGRRLLERLSQSGRVTERLRDGFAVAVVGEPNAGKSTLINFILQRDAVIVSEIPGTTRDYLEFFVELGGLPVVFVDTAGFRMTDDPIERLGIERSRERVRAVDLIVWLSDQPHAPQDFLPVGVPVLKVRSKCDDGDPPDADLAISARTGRGVDALVQRIVNHAREFFADAGTAGLGTERQRAAVARALAHIESALAQPSGAEELIAEDIRGAMVAVGRVTGRVDVEEVLDEVFARLCIGK